MGRNRGTVKTPDYIVDIINNLVKQSSQQATARATGLNLRTVQNYMKGIGYPTPEIFQKLSNYTGQVFKIVFEPER